MQRAPEHEHPGGAVPEPRHDHGQEIVEQGPRLPLPVAAQGDVDVVPEPGGERDVPAAPELREVERAVGVEEVVVQAETHQRGDADGEVGVAGEIKVDLHRVAQHRHQQLVAGVGDGAVEGEVVVDGQVVGQHALLQQAADDQPEAQAQFVPGGGLGAADLREEAPGARDRAGEQQREEREVEAEFEEVRMPVVFAAVHIHGVADGLEGVERNADGQDDVG